MCFFDRQDCNKSRFRFNVNGVNFKNIEKIITAEAAMIFSMFLVNHDVIYREIIYIYRKSGPQKSTHRWFSHNFSTSRDFFWNPWDQNHYFKVLNKFPWRSPPGNICDNSFKFTQEFVWLKLCSKSIYHNSVPINT